MLHLIACRFRRTEWSIGWEQGYIITTDVDGQDKPGHIILQDGSIYTPIDLWDIQIDHYNGHYHLDFTH